MCHNTILAVQLVTSFGLLYSILTERLQLALNHKMCER